VLRAASMRSAGAGAHSMGANDSEAKCAKLGTLTRSLWGGVPPADA
jgi:hypothetical protein